MSEQPDESTPDVRISVMNEQICSVMDLFTSGVTES